MASKKEPQKDRVTKKSAKPHAGGRPTKFEERFIREARILCEEGGFTDAKLARFYGVNRNTIHGWKREHEEFAKAVQEGKDAFDFQAVEKSLLKKCLGFKYTETTREPCIVRPKDGPPEIVNPTLAVTKTVRKFVVPDTVAIIFHLKNRHPERWRDVMQHEHGGKNGGPIELRALLDQIDGTSRGLPAQEEDKKDAGTAEG